MQTTGRIGQWAELINFIYTTFSFTVLAGRLHGSDICISWKWSSTKTAVLELYKIQIIKLWKRPFG